MRIVGIDDLRKILDEVCHENPIGCKMVGVRSRLQIIVPVLSRQDNVENLRTGKLCINGMTLFKMRRRQKESYQSGRVEISQCFRLHEQQGIGPIVSVHVG